MSKQCLCLERSDDMVCAPCFLDMLKRTEIQQARIAALEAEVGRLREELAKCCSEHRVDGFTCCQAKFDEMADNELPEPPHAH